MRLDWFEDNVAICLKRRDILFEEALHVWQNGADMAHINLVRFFENPVSYKQSQNS